MTLALFFLGWFAISLLLGAAWAATASTRRRGMDTVYPLVMDQPELVSGATMYQSDALAS